MGRRSGVLWLAGIVAIIVLAAGVSAGAAPSNTRQGQTTKVEAAQARLAELRGQTGAAYESYNNALFELNQLDDKIASAKKSRASAQKDVDSARKSLQDQAAQMYKSGNVGFMDVIVGARSFSEFTGRLELWIQLLEQDRAKLAQVREARDNLARKENALESQRKQRVAALDGAVSDKENATKLQSQAQAYLGSLDKNLAQAVQAEQERQAELARQDAARASANVQAAPSVAVAQPIQVPKLDKAAPGYASTPSSATVVSAPRSATSPEKVPASQSTSAPETTLSPDAVSATRPVPATPEVKPAAVESKTDNSAGIEKAGRLARIAAQQAEAKKKAADQAAARQKDAEKEAAGIAADKKATADQAAAVEKARRDAEAAAKRAAVEKAAADRKAAEQEAAKQAAEQAAKRAAVERDQIAAKKAAGAEQASQQTLAQQTAGEQPDAAPLPATTEATVPQETTAPLETTQAPIQAAVPSPPATTPATTTEATVPPSPATTPATTTDAPDPQPVVPAPGSGSGSSVVAEAQTWLGVPYVWGGASRSGVDCSGLTMLVFSQFGISLPHSAAAQDGYGSPGSGAAGDLVFGDFQGTGTITHVGIATGDGRMINAPYPGTVVRYDPIYPQYTLDYRTLL